MNVASKDLLPQCLVASMPLTPASFLLNHSSVGLMNGYILFFVVYTAMQIFFAGCYFILVRHIDLTMIMGTAIYLLGMLCAYQGYRFFQYRQKRKELLDSLSF